MTLGQSIIAATRARYGLIAAPVGLVAAKLRIAESTAYAWQSGGYDPPAKLAARLSAAHDLTIRLSAGKYTHDQSST